MKTYRPAGAPSQTTTFLLVNISPLRGLLKGQKHNFTTSPLHYFTTSPLHHFTISPFPSATIRASIVDKSTFFPHFINNALKCYPVQILLTVEPAQNVR